MASVPIDVRPNPRSAALPAGPSPMRLVRSIAQGHNGARYMRGLAREYGDLVFYSAMGRNTYQVNHPALIADFFLKDAPNHHRNVVMQSARSVLGHGLLTSEEPLHMRQRRLAQPAFLRERIAAYAEVIGDQTLALMRHWKMGEVVDLHPQMLELALRIVGKCLFDLDDFEDLPEMESAVNAFMAFVPLSFLPFSERIQQLPIPAMQRLQRGKRYLDGLIYRMIAERRRDSADRGDLLSMLLNATDAEGDGAATSMTDLQLRDECVTVILAGHETTANGLSFALHLLAHHPEAQERLCAEASEVLGDRTRISAADYARLPYATQVFAEAMRLYPPVWVTARTNEVEYEIAGYKIPVGATLTAPQCAVHRDPRFWADPDRFDPARHAAEAKAERPRYAYFPFAGGSRQCIAEGLAWMEGTFVLALIAREFRLAPAPGADAWEALATKPAVSLRPARGIRLMLTRR